MEEVLAMIERNEMDMYEVPKLISLLDFGMGIMFATYTYME